MGKKTVKDEQFPELFNDGKMRVYKNPSNEIFIVDIATGAKMRVSSNERGLGFTAFSHRVQPTVVAGSIGYEVVSK